MYIINIYQVSLAIYCLISGKPNLIKKVTPQGKSTEYLYCKIKPVLYGYHVCQYLVKIYI